MADSPKEGSPRLIRVLEALKQASHELQTTPTPDSDESISAVKALLELDNDPDSLLLNAPELSSLSRHLSDLKSLIETLHEARGHGLRMFLTRRVSTHSISRVAGSIESEIQAWIDRESVETLIESLSPQQQEQSDDEDELVMLLTQFESRVLEGFNRELQDLILKSKVFSSLESCICNSNQTNRIREHAAFCLSALIRFNKDVFVGQVFIGSTIQALLAIGTTCSMKVLCRLIKSIRSPLLDEIVTNKQIPKIIHFLEHKETAMQVLALDCILEIGYFGRKEAIEAMLEEKLIAKLVEMQRSELGGDLIEMAVTEGNDVGRRVKSSEFLEKHPFASCVARFAVQLEVGEGLRRRERRALKQQVLIQVSDVSVSDAEAATILAEVLWGSSP